MSLDFLADDSVQVEEEKDTLGGGSFLVESGTDEYEIEAAFLGKSAGGANSLTVHLKSANALVRETLWITSGTAKGCKPYYENKKTGKLHHLPGFALANALALVVTGKELKQLPLEEKVIKLYNKDAGAEINTSVQAFPDLMGQKVVAGILKVLEDKTTNVAGEGQPADYQPTGESREKNEISKFFCARDSHKFLTSTEMKGGIAVSDDTFYHKWMDKNTGTVVDKTTKTPATGGVAGAPAAAQGGAAKGMFD